MKLSNFRALKLKSGDALIVVWRDITSLSHYAYKPELSLGEQYGIFMLAGWVVRCDNENLEIAVDLELPTNGVTVDKHLYREVVFLPVGCIVKIAMVPTPKKWYS